MLKFPVTPKLMMSLISVLFVVLCGCSNRRTNRGTHIEEVAGNAKVDSFMRNFEGRGALTDSSVATPPQDALKTFRYPNDLALELVLSEPAITQPLHISFDFRGRMWVVQYNQYPYPRGLKVVDLDQYLRATYNHLPAAPPAGQKGADKITVFEDKDGDGKFESSRDVITGLNMATSVVLGRKKIWVLNPPYLIAYPDSNNDGLPDGAPEVHLSGFGLEDTHAAANSLRWGPDGWLYGAQGSTCTADVSSAVSKNVRFNGQAIWRYHPGTKVFEVYAEGGGNTFYVEIDEKGRFFSGHNGNERGMYYKEGAYYVKNNDKHGPVTNPYAFGYLPSMPLKGDKIRFTHAFIRYQGAGMPKRYNGKMIAINPLQNFVQLSSFDEAGSSFKNTDLERILTSSDRWFRPVDIKTGPDGGIYLADWYDSRLSHIDPRDTWDKGSGRIYRLHSESGKTGVPPFDISSYNTDQLVKLLYHPEKWYRQQALQQFADRKDRSVVDKLIPVLRSGDAQAALEALWAINLSGGLTDEIAITALQHGDPFVRMWAVRLLGDSSQLSQLVLSAMIETAEKEPHAEVRSQLAATAKRRPGKSSVAIIKALLINHNDSADPDIPLQLWWAIEAKAATDRQLLLNMFADKAIWKQETVKRFMLKNLAQRAVMAGGEENFNTLATLLALAPSADEARMLVAGLNEGLRGGSSATLPLNVLQALKPYQAILSKELLTISLSQGQHQAFDTAIKIIPDNKVKKEERLQLIRLIGELAKSPAAPVLINITLDQAAPVTIREAAMHALQRFNLDFIGTQMVAAYPTAFASDSSVRNTALSLFASRVSWAKTFLEAVEKPGTAIKSTDVPIQVARQLMALNDATISQQTKRLWPAVGTASTAEKNTRITQILQVLKEGTGDAVAGKRLFINTCGSCHKLFNEGNAIGPDLTGYDRRNITDLLINIVDPSAYIREGYLMTQLVTKDGRTLLGTIKNRNEKTISLQLMSGEQITLANDKIKEMKELTASLMPEKLLDNLSAKETRDLFAYFTKETN